jgi:hypothetical protein
MKEYTNIIEKLLKDSDIPPPPEAVLAHLLETYLTESESRYSNRHHTDVVTRMLSLLNNYKNKVDKNAEDAKQ